MEEHNANNEHVKKWVHKDVLYSFLGIYSIGLWVYYPDHFERTDYMIRPINRKRMNKVSIRYLCEKAENGKERYLNYEKLNNVDELISFIKIYNCAGNVIPVWPGANVNRGMGYCFDIPDIYFRRDDIIEWTRILRNMNDKIYLDEVMKSKYSSDTQKFLDRINGSEKEYKDFLKHCISVISNRNKKLCSYCS